MRARANPFDANHQTSAAVSDTAAAIAIAACMPRSNRSGVVSIAPKTATPSAAPVCRAEFSTPAAIPARFLSTVSISERVAMGVMRPAKKPIAGMGSAISQYGEVSVDISIARKPIV